VVGENPFGAVSDGEIQITATTAELDLAVDPLVHQGDWRVGSDVNSFRWSIWLDFMPLGLRLSVGVLRWCKHAVILPARGRGLPASLFIHLWKEETEAVSIIELVRLPVIKRPYS